jgi:hypothetical protein
MEVAIPEMYEQDETPQMSQHISAGSFIDVEGQLCKKPAGQPGLDENILSGRLCNRNIHDIKAAATGSF